eukprot:8407377-Lingulodinium_polyedra.AAC.1
MAGDRHAEPKAHLARGHVGALAGDPSVKAFPDDVEEEGLGPLAAQPVHRLGDGVAHEDGP